MRERDSTPTELDIHSFSHLDCGVSRESCSLLPMVGQERRGWLVRRGQLALERAL